MALAPESPKIEQQSQKTLVVEVVSLRPIEKFRRAVAKMPRVSIIIFKNGRFVSSMAFQSKHYQRYSRKYFGLIFIRIFSNKSIEKFFLLSDLQNFSAVTVKLQEHLLVVVFV